MADTRTPWGMDQAWVITIIRGECFLIPNEFATDQQPQAHMLQVIPFRESMCRLQVSARPIKSWQNQLFRCTFCVDIASHQKPDCAVGFRLPHWDFFGLLNSFPFTH